MRAPTIAWWPGKIKGGTVNMEIGSIMDIFVTSLAAANISLPTDRIYDGVNLLPALTQSGRIPRECLFYYRQNQLQALRCGSFKAQFISQCGYCNDPPVTHSPPLLYNIDQDLMELYPLNTSLHQYEKILNIMNEVINEHEKNMVTGPPNLNGMDFLIMPCCNHLNGCNCQPPYAQKILHLRRYLREILL